MKRREREREKKVKRLNVLLETVESTCYVTNDTMMPVSRDPIAMIAFVYLGNVNGRSHANYSYIIIKIIITIAFIMIIIP